MAENDPRTLSESLRVDVSAMRRRGETYVRREADLSVAWLSSVLASTDAEVREPGSVSFDVSLPDAGAGTGVCPVIVSGSLRAALVVPCGRCLEDAFVDGTTRIDALFQAEVDGRGAFRPDDPADPDDPDDPEVEDGNSPDTWTYDGTLVDLLPVVAEYVKLAYPMRALCALGEACQGLCSGCGNNFNETPPRVRGQRSWCVNCGQEFFGPVGDPRLAASPEDADEDVEVEEEAVSGALADALRKLQLRD